MERNTREEYMCARHQTHWEYGEVLILVLALAIFPFFSSFSLLLGVFARACAELFERSSHQRLMESTALYVKPLFWHGGTLWVEYEA